MKLYMQQKIKNSINAQMMTIQMLKLEDSQKKNHIQFIIKQ